MSRSLRWILLAVLAPLGLGLGLHLAQDQAAALRRAKELMAEGRFAEAAQAFAAIEGDPARDATSLDARLFLIRARILSKDGEAAASAALQLLDALPQDHAARLRVRLLAAEAQQLLRRHDEASAIYAEEATRMVGDSEKARIAATYLSLARAREKEVPSDDPLKPGRPALPAVAADLYIRALQVLTDGRPRADLTIPRARCLIAAGNPAPAVAELRLLLEDPGLPAPVVLQARHLLAEALVLAGQPAPARAELERVLAHPDVDERPEGPAALRLLGKVLLELPGGERERLEFQRQGIAAWRRWLQKFGDREEAPLVRREMAERLRGLGDHEETLAALEAVASDRAAKPGAVAWALFQRGLVLRDSGRFDEAREALRRFLAQCPDDANVPEAQRMLPELLLLKAAARQEAKDEDGAILALRQYLDEFPTSAQAAAVAVEIGRILRARKKVAEAASAFAAARDRYRQAQPEDAARAALLLAVVEEEDREDLENAARELRRLREEFPGTAAVHEAARRLGAMEDVELELTAPRIFRSGEPCALELTTRNLKSVSVRVYRLDAAEVFRRKGTLAGAAAIEVALVKADATYVVETPDFRRYERRRRPYPVALEPGRALPAGAYLVAAETEELRSTVLLLVSDVHVVVKQSPHEVFCWTVDARTGEPLEGVTLLVQGPGVQAELRSGKDGVARLVHPEPRGRCEVLALHEGGVAPGSTEAPPASSAAVLAPRAAFLLDRPIYKPGSEVRFRVVLRDVDRGSFVTPESGQVRASLRDPSGRELAAGLLDIGPFGVATGSFPIAADGPLGDYRVHVDFAGQGFSERAVVEAYRRPELEVSVLPRSRVLRPGESTEVDLAVAWFFGGPAAGLRYEWRLWRGPHQIDRDRYLGHAWYLKATAAEGPVRAGAGMSFMARGEGVIDEKGLSSFTIEAGDEAGLFRYVLEVLVRDATGNWVSGHGVVHGGLVDRFAVLLSEKKAVRAGESIELRVVTADLGHRGVATPGRVQVLRERSRPEGGQALETAGEYAVDTGLSGEATLRIPLEQAGAYRIRFEGKGARGEPVAAETRVDVAGQRPDLSEEAVLRFEREVVKAGETARLHLNVPEAGRPCLLCFEGERVLDYRILRPEATSSVQEIAIDEALAPNITVGVALPWKDRLLSAADSLTILRYLEISVRPDRERAKPKDEVAVRVETRDQAGRPVAASVALRIVDRALSDLGGFAGEDPRFVFNRDRRPHLVRTGSSLGFRNSARGEPLDRDLIDLAREEQRRKDRAQLGEVVKELAEKSGEDVLATLAVRELARDADFAEEEAGDKNDEMAKPGVAGGRRRDQRAAGGVVAPGMSPAPDSRPMEPGLKGAAGLQQAGALLRRNLAGYEVLDPASHGVPASAFASKLAFGETTTAYLPLAGGGLGSLPEPPLRRDFREVVGFWPSILTGPEGQASVTCTLPENLTEWDLAASGADRGTGVGRGTATLGVRQDVQVRVGRPRYLSSRDEVALSLLVHSDLAEEADFVVGLRSEDPGRLALRGASEFQDRVAAGASAERRVAAAAVAAGEARLLAEARSTRGGDAIHEVLPVAAFGAPFEVLSEKELTDRVVFEVEVPETLVAGSEDFRVVVQAGLPIDLVEGLEYLRSYPHGCLEQGIHRVLPALALEAAFRAAGVPYGHGGPALRARATRLLVDLRAHQNPDGGLAMWPGGPSDPYATGLGARAIARIAAEGIPVDAGFSSSVLGAVRAQLARLDEDPDARAGLLRGGAELGLTEDQAFAATFRDRERLSVAGLAQFVLAAKTAGKDTWAQAAFDQLRGRRQTEAPWPYAGRRPGHWHSSHLEATGLALQAHVAMGAGPGETGDLARAVRQGLRTKEGATKGVAEGLAALAGFVASEAGAEGGGRVLVSVDDEPVGEGRMDARQPRVVVPLPPAKLAAGKRRVTVTKDAGRSASCRLLLQAIVPAEDVAADGNVFEVRRRVIPFRDPVGKDEDSVPGWSIVRPESRPKPVPPPTLHEVVSGTKVSVELTIRAREDALAIVVRDPIFATLDPIPSGVRGPVDRQERREAEMVFFLRRLEKGREVVITYPCFALFEGRFFGLPATAAEMYAPERQGRSGSATLRVVPDPSLLTRVAPDVPTPDQRLAQARRAFARSDYDSALAELAEIRGLDLEDGPWMEVHELWLRSELRREGSREALEAWRAIQTRSPGRDPLARPDRLRLGRAFLDAGDAFQAREHFQAVLLAVHDDEARVAEELWNLGESEPALSHLRATLLRYPQAGSAVTQALVLADRYLELEDAALGRSFGLSARARSRWREAFSVLLDLMAWHQGTGLGEAASIRRIRTLVELGSPEPLRTDAERYLRVFGNSAQADEVTFRLAEALFLQGRYEEAIAPAREVAEARWPRGAPEPRPSGHRDAASFLVGRAFHVLGRYDEAVEWYGRVKDRVPDALQSWRFFTEEVLRVGAVTQSRPGEPPRLSAQAKNLGRVQVQIFPVDLSVLFAVKKSFERLNTADLAGIRPAQVVEIETGLARHALGEVQIVLPELAKGAYLLTLRGGGIGATTLHLVADARLTVQRAEGNLRVYLVDGAGRPLAGARVRIGHGGRIVRATETDERGLVSLADPGAGPVTVVAEKGADVAVVIEP